MNDKNDEISKKLHDYFTKYYDFVLILLIKI